MNHISWHRATEDYRVSDFARDHSLYNGNSVKKFVNSDKIYCDELSGEELLIIVKNK